MSDPSKPNTTTPFSPTPYSVWATENPFENELEGRTKHLDNLRLETIRAGKYNEDFETDLQERFETSLIEKGLLTQSNQQQVQEAILEFSNVLPSNQKDVLFVKDNMGVGSAEMDFEEGEQEKILRYAKALETGQELPEDIDVNEVHEIARQKRQNYVTELYENGTLSAGVYYNKSGRRVFLGGKMDDNSSEAEILQQMGPFGVVPRDVFSFRDQREVQKDKNDLMLYEVDQRERAQDKVEAFLDPQDPLKDEKTVARFDALATSLGKAKSWGWMDKGVDSTGEVFVSIASNIRESWNWATGDDEEKKFSEDYQRFEGLREEYEDDYDQTHRDLIADLAEKTGLSGQILEDVVDDMVVEIAGNGSDTQEPTLNYAEDDDELTENVVRRKYRGNFIQPALALTPEKFRKTLSQAGFTAEEIKMEDGKRLASNELLAASRSDLFRADNDYVNAFQLAEISGAQAGLTQAEIVEKFVADEDPNLGLEGVGLSVVQGFSTLYYGAGALFGAEYGTEGLLENAKDQAHLNQMRTIFGQDAGVMQTGAEQIAPMAVDAVIGFGAALLSAPTLGTSVAAAGGYFAVKQGATAMARAALKNTFNTALKQQLRNDATGRLIKESTGAAVRRLQTAGTLKGLSNQQMISVVKNYNGKVAKSLSLNASQFAPAALRSGSMTYGAVHRTVYDDYTQRYTVNGEWVDGWSEQRVKEVAHKAGFESMIAAGTTTGLITAIAGKLGGGKYGGLESAVLQGVSFRALKKSTDRMVARVSSDKAFLEYMEKAVSSTLKEAGLGLGGRVIRGGVGEAAEEFIDEFANTIIQDAWTQKETSFADALSSALMGAAVGGFMGAASPAIGGGLKELAPTRSMDSDKMVEIDQKVDAEFRRLLGANDKLKAFENLEKTAPQSNAEFIKRVKAEYTKEEAAAEEAAAEEAAKEPENEKEVTKEDVTEEAKQLEQDVEDNATPETQQKVINEAESEKKTKNQASPIVSTSDAITGVTETDTNPAAANADVTSNTPSANPPLTPQQKYENSIKDIQAREKKYNTQIAALGELPADLQPARLAEIKAQVRDGRMVTSVEAGLLITKANRQREKAIADEAKPAKVTKKDLDKLEAIIDQGFPVADISTNLEQLGLTLGRTDEKYLRAVEKVIKEKIAERYPTINPKLKNGGVRLPNTLVPSGTVIIDRDGNGVFNNDPAGMVTLLRNNVAIPLTEDQATNPNLNKSFVVEKQGDNYFVSDIMVPVKGGLISAKTPITKIGVHESDYGPVKDKIRRVTTLRNTVDLDAVKDVKVESPFRLGSGKKPSQISFVELLKEARNLPALKKILTQDSVPNLSKDYLDTAALTMSLDLQEQIYKYAQQEAGGNLNLDLKASAIKNAKFFGEVEAARKSKAIRDVASLLEPDSDITKRPDLYDVEKQSENSFIPPKVATIKPIAEPKIQEYISSKIDDVATAINLDERLRRDVKDLLNNEYHGGKKVTNNYSAEQVAIEFVHFLASNSGSNRPAAVLESKLSSRSLSVINPEYKLGQDMKDALTLLGVTSPTLHGSLDVDTEFYSLIETQLKGLVGKDAMLSYADVKTFYTQVRNQAAVHKKRAINDGRSRGKTRRKNLAEIEQLGLIDDDPQSVIDALEEVAESGQKPYSLLAKTLLKNKELIRSVRFFIDSNPASFAGAYYMDGLGQRTVVINVDRGTNVVDTLIHEYLHAFTNDIFRTPPEHRTAAQNEAVTNLEELLRIAQPFARKSGKGNLVWGTANIDEFLTHILTDTEFQKFLNGVIPSKGGANLLQRIIREVAKLLGVRTSELKSAIQAALDLTKSANRPQPETKASFASQAAGSIHKSQAQLHQMSKDMDMGNDAAVNEKLEERSKEIVEFAAAYVPSELNVVVDEASPEIATVDNNTGALILNPKRAALYLANQGVEGLDAQRRKHALGIILNKAVGQAAADTMITDDQYVAITESMTESEIDAEIREAYPLDEQEAAFERLRSADAKVSATERFDLAKKAIARHTDLATTGRTTNQQIAFLQSNPSLIPTFITYMKAFLSKLTYHRTLKDVSPEMRKAVNNTVREIRGLALNYKPAPSIMNHNPRDPYAVVEKLMGQAIDVNMLEPTTKTDSASLRNRLIDQKDSESVVLRKPDTQPDTESQFGQDSKLPTFATEVEMQEKDIGNWLEILDVPLLEFSEDYEFSKMGRVKRTLYKTFLRAADKRVVNFYDQNKAFVRETKGLVDELQKKHNRILKAEDARLSSITGTATGNIPAQLIARASGTTEGSQLTTAQEDLVQEGYLKDLANANKLPTVDEKNAAIDLAEAGKKQKTLDLREANRKKQFAERDAAMHDLLSLSPDMYNLVIEMRQIQDQLSKKAIEIFGPSMNPEDLNMAFDFNRGLYLTRSYRMFEDRNFSKRVKESDQYAEVRERAVAYFMKQLQSQAVDKLVLGGTVTKGQAQLKVREEAVGKDSKMQSDATAMMNNFIDGYSRAESRKKILSSQRQMGEQNLVLQDVGFPKGGPLEKIVEKINNKKEIPEPIKELLGEFGEDTGIYNLSYSLNHTASMISNQAFFNKLKELGTNSDNPWMVTRKEYLDNPAKYPDWDTVLVEGSGDLNPLKGMYVPIQVISNLKSLFGGKEPDITDPLNEMAELQGMLMRATKKSVGLSLAYKVLGSPSFYIRNVIGNMLFFGPMQGYPSHRVIRDFGRDATGMFTKNPDSVFYQLGGSELSFKLRELRSRNVYGDELEVSQIQELLSGKISYDSLANDLDKVAAASGFLKKIKNKSGAVKIPDEHIEILAKVGVKITETGMMPVKALLVANKFLLEKGGALASACDGFFKIGLYDFEMKTLIEAAQHDIENGKPYGKYGKLLDNNGEPNNTMKDMAAEIVKDTAQSYSRALPVIKSFTSSNLSIAIAPYVRFAADVPRVFANGLARGVKERGSDNPVIKARGRKRLLGATRTTAASVAMTKGSQMLLWGIDDEDEDKAFRAMVPKWMKNAGILVFKDSDGDTWSADITYLNPFAIIQDPAVRAIESLVRGEGIKEATTKFIGQVLKPYASEQILTGAFLDVFQNENQYGSPIVLDGDDDKFARRRDYIFEKAFSPRSLMSADAAYDSFLSKESTASFFDSGIGHLLKSVMPLRLHQQDYTAGVGRYLYNHTDEYRNNNQAFNTKMGQMGVLPKKEVLEAYDRFLRNRMYLNNDFKQTIRGFEKIGLSRSDIARIARSRGVSADRLKNNQLGFMRRPVPSAPLKERLEETANGRRRLQYVKEHYEQNYPNEHISIDK